MEAKHLTNAPLTVQCLSQKVGVVGRLFDHLVGGLVARRPRLPRIRWRGVVEGGLGRTVVAELLCRVSGLLSRVAGLLCWVAGLWRIVQRRRGITCTKSCSHRLQIKN